MSGFYSSCLLGRINYQKGIIKEIRFLFQIFDKPVLMKYMSNAMLFFAAFKTFRIIQRVFELTFGSVNSQVALSEYLTKLVNQEPGKLYTCDHNKLIYQCRSLFSKVCMSRLFSK